jgi:hypothetical protein
MNPAHVIDLVRPISGTGNRVLVSGVSRFNDSNRAYARIADLSSHPHLSAVPNYQHCFAITANINASVLARSVERVITLSSASDVEIKKIFAPGGFKFHETRKTVSDYVVDGLPMQFTRVSRAE